MQKIGVNDQVLFVCKGNINRSAFAAEYLRQRYSVEVESAGTLLKRNRFSTKIAEKIASERYNIDLSLHRSETLFKKDLTKFDLIIVFDDQNYAFITSMFSGLKEKVSYLMDGVEIKDPYLQEEEFYINVFDVIKNQIDTKLEQN